MSTLHFRPLNSHRAQLAIDELGFWYIIEKQELGWLGLVLDLKAPYRGIVHKVDWTDHLVHVDEIRRHLQSWADEAEKVLPLDFRSRTSTLEEVDKKETDS